MAAHGCHGNQTGMFYGIVVSASVLAVAAMVWGIPAVVVLLLDSLFIPAVATAVDLAPW